MVASLQKSPPNQLGLQIVSLIEPLDVPPRYNGAPGKKQWVIRQHPNTGERTLDRLWWGLMPHWCKDADGGRKPVNAKAETVATLPSFRDAYKHRRCLVPIDNFFEWKAIKGVKTKQPYAIAMKSGEPFALAGISETCEDCNGGMGTHVRNHHHNCERTGGEGCRIGCR